MRVRPGALAALSLIRILLGREGGPRRKVTKKEELGAYLLLVPDCKRNIHPTCLHRGVRQGRPSSKDGYRKLKKS